MASNKESSKKWLEFLDPENLKDNLVFSALYIATFESFKDYITNQIKFFFNSGFSNRKFTFSERYKTEVLSKDKNLVNATLLYLKSLGTIDDADIEIFNELRKYRNKLSHELMELLFDGLPKQLPDKFVELINLRIKIEKWWILNIEIPTDPDYDSENIVSEEDICSSSQIFYRIILDMLSGDEKKSNFYKSELEKIFKDK